MQFMVILGMKYLNVSLVFRASVDIAVYIAAIVIFCFFMIIYSVIGSCSNTCVALKNINKVENV